MPLQRLACVTTNKLKFELGQEICKPFGFALEQVVADIDEIQGEDPDKIVRRKAADAYAAAGRPVVVTDDSWAFQALRGFPGAYMKSMNYWFGPDDFLRLMHGVADRRIFLQQYLAYHDGEETVVFGRDIPGRVLETARGKAGDPVFKVVALDADHGLSIAEVYDQGKEHDPARFSGRQDAWHDFAAWYKSKFAQT